VGAVGGAAGDQHRDRRSVAGQGLGDLGQELQVGHYRGGLMRMYYDVGYYGTRMVAWNAMPTDRP